MSVDRLNLKRLLVVIALLTITLPAGAATDLGDGACLETTGELGLWNGTTPDDAGCVTFAEYTIQVGPETLDDQLVVGPDPEPAAPTVREYWDEMLGDVRVGGPR